MKKRVFICSIIPFLFFFLLFPTESHSQSKIWCTIEIDRSNTPSLYFTDITVLVTVNDGRDFNVESNTDSAIFTQDGDTLILTTDASEITLSLTPGNNQINLCKVSVAPLRENKSWAWSHGFDDNVGLRLAIEEFRKKSWTATIFAIAKDFSQFRQENWIIDEPFFNANLLVEGWALGNHSWNHERFDSDTPTQEAYLNDILDGQTRLNEAIARSTIPEFKVIVFASPNFSSQYDQPFLQAQNSTDLLLQETGNDYMLVVTGEDDYITDGLTAKSIANRIKIGRDISVELNPQLVIDNIDWMAENHASSNQFFWYNTLAHGDHEASLKTILDHVWSSYGPEGTNEAWVASSSEIYSYLLTRDSVLVQSNLSNDGQTPPLANEIFMPSIIRLQSWASSYVEDEQKTQLEPLLLNLTGHGLQQLKSER